MFTESCHSRSGWQGLGMAVSWGTEDPRLGEISRLGFYLHVRRRLRVVVVIEEKKFVYNTHTAGVIFSFISSKAMVGRVCSTRSNLFILS